MKIYMNPEPEKWAGILTRPTFDTSELFDKVGSILARIKSEGDSALKEFTLKFDSVAIDTFEVSQNEISLAGNKLDTSLKEAISVAARNIRIFHESQKTEEKRIETLHGVVCWQKQVAIEKVGLYIPGGTAPLFSTVLMLAIPALIAGCEEIILCSPPDKTGKIHPAILYAAGISGVTKVFRLGGVQAIGAMAYGTESVLKVDKIFGPGNQYVMAAKQLVSLSDVAVDMPAGPSEVAVIADETSNPEFIAADLLSQAEHGPDSQVVLVSKDKNFIEMVVAQVMQQLEKLSRKEIAKKTLENSRLILMEDENKLLDLVNQYAPEHLIIATRNYRELASLIKNAGSVFLGPFTPESAGDYASGTNHTLPTNGWAKSFSGINLDSFTKKITFQEITGEGLKNIGLVIETMASAEQLEAHKNAVTLRLNEINNLK
jgi:histidinol dehydrogenase